MVNMGQMAARRQFRRNLNAYLRSPEGRQYLVERKLKKELRKAGGPVRRETSDGFLMAYPNWRDARGNPKVVMRCNTKLPGSDMPAAAMLLKKRWFFLNKERFSDLSLTSLTALERTLDEGLVWIFPCNFTLGGNYVILPAPYKDTSGNPFFGCAPNVSRYQGKTFVIGPANAGVFLDFRLHDRLIVRQTTPTGVWCGRSSKTVNGKLAVGVEPFLGDGRGQRFEFLLPIAKGTKDIAALSCKQQDDSGFPVGVYSNRPAAPPARVLAKTGLRRKKTPARRAPKPGAVPAGTPLVVAHEGDQYLVAYPNSTDAQGRSAFTAYANSSAHGREVYLFSSSVDGRARDYALPANARAPDGRAMFVGFVNGVIRGKRALLIKIG